VAGQAPGISTQAGLRLEDSDVIDYLDAIKRNPAEA
jgi:hypothetical protein